MNSQQVQSSPKRIANYLLSHEKIGEGSFGSVFLGYDTTNNNHTVAIKVINRAKLTGTIITKYRTQCIIPYERGGGA
jgi:hypothetical protein